jgi:DNA-binding PadR family transcriptional regulator
MPNAARPGAIPAAEMTERLARKPALAYSCMRIYGYEYKMKPGKRLSNPLALAVLVQLFEKPMHPYEMAATMKERGKEQSIKLHYGSLYTVIEQLLREGYISAGEPLREGKRPEKTVYSLTPAGQAEMNSWLGELLAEPTKEYPRFEAALSLMPALPPERVLSLLDTRLQRLDGQISAWRSSLAGAIAQSVPALFLIETEYQLALLDSESRFVQRLQDGIRNSTLEGVDVWRQWHQQTGQGGSTP